MLPSRHERQSHRCGCWDSANHGHHGRRSKTATCTVTVTAPPEPEPEPEPTPPPYIPPTKTPSQQAVDKIEDAKEGSTVKITLRTGQTKLDKEVLKSWRAGM